MTEIHPKKTYYPTYDVYSEKNEWDTGTQEVLHKRVHPVEGSMLTADMKRTLQAIAKSLFPSHIGEQTLSISMNLDQRLTNKKLKAFPKGAAHSKEQIILQGLTFAEHESILEDKKPFFQLSDDEKHEKLHRWRVNKGNNEVWTPIKSSLFYTTITAELLKLIYSDPSVWSNIGFGGPAYPRGYYAFGPKQFDNWEAKPHDENLI